MYKAFTVLDIATDKKNKDIIIYFSNELDFNSIDGKTIYLYRKSDGDVIPLKYSVDGSIVTLHILRDYSVNVEYELVVNTKVKNISDEYLTMASRETIVFESDIHNEAVILSPVDHEELKNCTIRFKEVIKESEVLHGKYQVQISSDVGFFNNYIDTQVDTNELTVNIVWSEQYFVRVRVLDGEGNFGDWSDIITFTIADEYFQKDIVNDDYEDEEVIYEEEYEIVSFPEQGITPDMFVIEFDGDIDAESIEDMITVIKRRV